MRPLLTMMCGLSLLATEPATSLGGTLGSAAGGGSGFRAGWMVSMDLYTRREAHVPRRWRFFGSLAEARDVEVLSYASLWWPPPPGPHSPWVDRYRRARRTQVGLDYEWLPELSGDGRTRLILGVGGSFLRDVFLDPMSGSSGADGEDDIFLCARGEVGISQRLSDHWRADIRLELTERLGRDGNIRLGDRLLKNVSVGLAFQF